MSWNDLIISVCSIILTSLATWLSGMLISWLNAKLKDTKAQRYINDLYRIMEESVKSTYQTYVDGLKGTEAWTKKAQLHALNMALEAGKTKLSAEAVTYVSENFGDLDNYLTNLIEAIIYDLKNKA